MPALKPISGHSKSVKAVFDYLTKKERALACDYLNCSEVDRRGRPVWCQMDETRHALGCDVAVRGHSKVWTYEHFVLSPDPRDHVDLATLQDLTMTWVNEYFGSFQVGVVYHDDNELRIPHAHIIVNNANLDRPGRVSTILAPRFEAEIFKGLQRMAAERGLHAFTARPTSVNNAEWAKADREREQRERPKGTVQRTYRTKRDKEMEAKGVSWKADVRDRMACALRLSSNEEEFVEACCALGLGVRESVSRRGMGEYVYRHPGGDAWEVSGPRLGRDWSRWGIQRRLDRDRRQGVDKPSGEQRDRLLSAVASLKTADGSMAMQVVGVARDVPVTTFAIVDMLDVCGVADVRCMDDFKEALREPMPPEERARLRQALATARALGYLPKERDKVDGARSTYEERRALRDGGRRASSELEAAASAVNATDPAREDEHVRDALESGTRQR